MIQIMMRSIPMGVWKASNDALPEPFANTVKSCIEKIEQLQIYGSNQKSDQDFSNGLKTLKVLNARIASFQTLEPGDLGRQTLVALLVEIAVGLRDLKPPPFDPAVRVIVDYLLVEMNQAIGEVPTLHEAAAKGCKEVVELLLSEGANVNAADESGEQPLHLAAFSGHLKVVELLLNKGANVNAASKSGFQPLHGAAKNGHVKVVELLLSKGAIVDAADEEGFQPLHWAAEDGRKEVVELLFSKGAKLDAADKHGNQPLDVAARNGHTKVVELLQMAAFNEPLLKVYRQQGYLTRFLDKKPFPIEQSFINLTIVEQENYEEVEGETRQLDPLSSRNAPYLKAKRIALSELFRGNSHLYIEGAAGSGKTTFCRYLVSTWATLTSEKRLETLGAWANQYDAIIFLPLREIRSLSETANLKDFLLERYPGLSFDKIDPSKTLYILDGFDEIVTLEEVCRISKEDKRWKIVEALIKQPHCMITSRPNIFSEQFYGCRRLQNLGFTDESIKAYIVRFCEDFKIESQGLEKAIFDQEDLKALAHIPLYLELVCSLWKENPKLLSSLNNFTTLYDEMTILLFRRHLMRLDVNTKGLFPKDILSHEAVVHYMMCLEAIAFDSQSSGSNRIGPEIYRPLLEHIPAVERETFSKRLFNELGLLIPIENPKDLLDQVYSFIHPTFEEYFAAKDLVCRLDSPLRHVNSSAADWLKANCLSKSLEKTIGFVAALAKSEKQLNTLAEGLLSEKQPKDSDKSSAWQLPLSQAARWGLLKLSELLLKKGVKVDTADKNGEKPLHLAAWKGHKEVVELLLKNGAKAGSTSKDGDQPLHYAAYNGDKAVVGLLVENGAKVDAADKNGWQPLHMAVLNGQREVVELLLKNGAKVDVADKDSWEPLHIAAQNGYKEVVELLLKNGAKVDAADKNGKEPLHVAAGHGHREVVELLLKNGAKVDAANKDESQPIHMAALNGHREVVELLLKNGAKIDAPDKNELQPLDCAAGHGHKEVVELLLKNGANVDAANKDESQSIHVAALNGHKEVVELLLKNGAKVNAADNNGEGPLHWAALNGHREVVELLLKNEAKVDAADKEGFQPLHWAAWEGQREVVELLLSRGAKVDAKDFKGKQPLHWAAFNGHREVAELLLSRGANKNAADNKGRKPLQLAASNSHTKVVELLLSE